MENPTQTNIDQLSEQYRILISESLDAPSIPNRFSEIRTVDYSAVQLQDIIGCTKSQLKKCLDEFENEGEYIQRNSQNHRRLMPDQAAKVMELFGFKSISTIRNEGKEYQTPVVLITEGKGGIGKSTTAITLATSAALDIQRGPRTLLFDADPQGSIGHQLSAASPDSVFSSVHDHIQKNQHLSRTERLTPERQAEFREYLLANVVLDSYIDNLSFIPSNSLDVNLETAIAGKLATGGGIDEAISLYNDLVFSPLKNDFDLIVIDSGPAVNTTLYNLYYSSNHLIMPTTARQQDFRAFIDYQLISKNIIDNIMPSDFQGFKSIRSLVTKHSDKNQAIEKRAVAIQQNSKSFITRIKENKAYEIASQSRLPLQLLVSTSSSTLKSANKDAERLYFEVSAVLFSDCWIG